MVRKILNSTLRNWTSHKKLPFLSLKLCFKTSAVIDRLVMERGRTMCARSQSMTTPFWSPCSGPVDFVKGKQNKQKSRTKQNYICHVLYHDYTWDRDLMFPFPPWCFFPNPFIFQGCHHFFTPPPISRAYINSATMKTYVTICDAVLAQLLLHVVWCSFFFSFLKQVLNIDSPVDHWGLEDAFCYA